MVQMCTREMMDALFHAIEDAVRLVRPGHQWGMNSEIALEFGIGEDLVKHVCEQDEKLSLSEAAVFLSNVDRRLARVE